MTDTDSPRKKNRFLAPLLAIALVTGALAVWQTTRDRGADATPGDFPDGNREAEVIEVEPLLPQGRIVAASWHRAGMPAGDERDAAPEPDEADAWMSIDQEEETEREKDLRKVLKRTGGLAVHVAESDDGSR